MSVNYLMGADAVAGSGGLASRTNIPTIVASVNLTYNPAR